jgi:hypothetical protein
MPFKTPPEIAAAGVATGVSKSRLSWDKALVAGGRNHDVPSAPARRAA